jgi:2-keto-3-deoxy-L-rhamnonate aldolase RhmA
LRAGEPGHPHDVQLRLGLGAQNLDAGDVEHRQLGRRRGFGRRSILTDFAGASTSDGVEQGNRETIVVVQIETADALADLENIVKVPGVDATMIGPHDLSISLGIPGQFTHEKLVAAFQRVADVCGPSPVAPGIHMGDAARLIELRGIGFRFLVYSTDLALMMKSLKEGMASLRGAPAGMAPAKAGMY